LAVVGTLVNTIINWDSNSWNYEGFKSLSPENTYILIFSPNQKASLKFFENNFKGTILYKSPAAVCHLHRERPIAHGGNIVVVFEWDKGTNPLGVPSMKIKKDTLFP